MKATLFRRYASIATACIGLSALGGVQAQLTVSDTLTGASSSFAWTIPSPDTNGACLTAGSGAGSIPACVGLKAYSGKTQVGGMNGRLPDTVGSGALRLTNGDVKSGGSNGDYTYGAVVSTDPFPSDQGLQVTFTTVTYGGDGGTGADGISFYLSDGSTDPATGLSKYPPSVGATGGALGYTCSNIDPSKVNGVRGAYIGLGIDEYGNFSNSGTTASSGVGFIPGRISLRGAGDTNLDSLQSNPATASYYSGLTMTGSGVDAIRNTCLTGYFWDYSKSSSGKKTSVRVPFNYKYLSGVNLPTGVTIANQQGTNMPLRSKATPITYGLSITQDGFLQLVYSVNGGVTQTIFPKTNINNPNPGDPNYNGPVPSSFRFGFTSGTGASNNVHEIVCFKAAPLQQSGSGGNLNTSPSSRLQSGTQLFLAYYHSSNWWGQVTGQSLIEDSVTHVVSVSPIANWDGGCGLTGGLCSASNGSNTAQGSSARTILTTQATTRAGIALQWSGLDSTQQAALTAGDATVSGDRLAYLRGDRSKEISNGGPFRNRTSVLGDVIDSSPAWVGPPVLPYTGPWKDALNTSATAPEGTSYKAFQTSNATRTNVVYVGSNDGLLHGFRAGAYSADGTFDMGSKNDGYELLAYMPAAVVSTIHSTSPGLDFASPQYAHNAYVDAGPVSADLYYQGAWHTWVAGGLGPGGNAGGVIGDATSVGTGSFYALDVTNPASFSEGNAASIVVGEWPSAATGIWANLGNTYGTPLIRRLHDGNWAVIFGNGLNSATGTAGIFIMTVDQNSGAKSFRFLDTGAGPIKDSTGAVSQRNGIAYVAPADLDSDHITDYLYAGDILGNVWRFDVTSSNAGSWAVSSAPIFKTGGLPITTRMVVAQVPSTDGLPRVMLAFGTGQILPQTQTSSAVPAAGTQYLMGVWDSNVSDWNSRSNIKYSGGSSAGIATLTPSSLQTQVISTTTMPSGSTTVGVRTIAQNPVCWAGSSVCSSGNTQYGWRVALPGTNEQIIYSGVNSDGLFVINTSIPGSNQLLSCTTVDPGGYTMALTLDQGVAPATSYFLNFGNTTTGGVVGLATGGTGTVTSVTTEIGKFLVMQTVTGSPTVVAVNPVATAKGKRVTWAKLR